MQKSATNLIKKMKLRKLNHMMVGGAIAMAVLVAPVAWAALLDVFNYKVGVAIQKAELLAQQALMKAIDQAQQKLQQTLYDKANTIATTIQGKLGTAVQDRLGTITGGPVGQVLGNAGLTIGDVTGPNAIGHVDPATTKAQMGAISKAKNPLDAITEQTRITLENQLHDRLNVTSVLDEKPVKGTCTTTTKNCTILTLLREQDAIALTSLQKVNLAAVGYQVTQKGSWDEAVLSKIYSITGTDTINVLSFLTPSNAIPLGFERNAATAANLEKSMWLSQVMVGAKNDAQFLAKEMQNKSYGDSASQMDAMSKIAKVQLARGAIMNVHNEDLHNSLNSQFRACVVRPDAQDRVGATQEQQLVHIQSLMRCNNMILLQMRQQELESQRLYGAMLLTLIDLYAVQEPGKRS